MGQEEVSVRFLRGCISDKHMAIVRGLGFAEWPPGAPARSRAHAAPVRMAQAAGSLRGRFSLPDLRACLYIPVAAFTLCLCFYSVCFVFLFGCKYLTRPRGAEPQRGGDWPVSGRTGPTGSPGPAWGFPSFSSWSLLLGGPANRQDVRGSGAGALASSSPVCFRPIRGGGTRNCSSGRAGGVPGHERPGQRPSRSARLPQPRSRGRSAGASRPPSAGSVGCAAHLHGGPKESGTPEAA